MDEKHERILKALARAIVDRDEVKAAFADRPEKAEDYLRLVQSDIGGLCTAARILGLVPAGHAFSSEWAKDTVGTITQDDVMEWCGYGSA